MAVTVGVKNLRMKARASVQRSVLAHVPTVFCIEFQGVARPLETHL